MGFALFWCGKVGMNWCAGMIGDAYDQQATVCGMQGPDQAQRVH